MMNRYSKGSVATSGCLPKTALVMLVPQRPVPPTPVHVRLERPARDRHENREKGRRLREYFHVEESVVGIL